MRLYDPFARGNDRTNLGFILRAKSIRPYILCLMIRAPQRHRKIVTILVLGAVVLFAGLVDGLWLPDLIFPVEHTLAKKRSIKGETVRVTQYWVTSYHNGNHYTTEFRVTSTNGILVKYEILESDSETPKRWRTPLTLRQQAGRTHAEITMSSTRVKEIDW
jgi:hypothetical protein